MPYFGTGESRGYGGSASGGKSARLKRKLRLKNLIIANKTKQYLLI